MVKRRNFSPKFTAQAIWDWLKAVGVRTLYIEPGSPWENGYVESFNGTGMSGGKAWANIANRKAAQGG